MSNRCVPLVLLLALTVAACARDRAGRIPGDVPRDERGRAIVSELPPPPPR